MDTLMRRLTRIKDNENFGLKLNHLKSISQEKLSSILLQKKLLSFSEM
jgi:hypothetical protein